MTKIENIEEKMILFEMTENNNNMKTTESLTNNLILVYYFISFNKTFTALVHLVESDKLFVFVKLFVQDSFEFDPFQLPNFPIKGFIIKNLIKL